MKKKVHLVLGSGGARGIAHIGVIDELVKDGYEIIEIVGCSMGAVIGGIYAAGHLQEYKEWLFSLDKGLVFELMDFTFTRQGFVKGEKIFAKHKEMTGNLNIDDFKIPFTAVATDMKNHEEVVFKHGDLYKALRASVSIPGLYIPVVEDGRILVDGGVLNPLPLNLVNKKEDAIIIAVDLNTGVEMIPALTGNKKGIKKKNESDKEEWKFPRWVEKLVPDQLLEMTKDSGPEEEALSLLQLMETTFSLTQDRLTIMTIERFPPDVLIQIPRKACGTFEFYRAKEIYEIGRELYRRSMN